MCIDGSSQSDLDIWADRAANGGGMEFVLWAWETYRLMDDEEWEGAGYLDALNQALPFAKVMNAIWLIEWGLSDNHDTQWHARQDYYSAAQGLRTRTHNQIHYEFGGNLDNGAIASARTGQVGEDYTDLGCPNFDTDDPNNHPALRASTMIHEGWHHWAQTHDRPTGHMEGPVGACSAHGEACDDYYFHGVGEFEFGDMWQWRIEPDGTRHRYHSSFQVEVEFLCDLAEYADSWVPASVTMVARQYANYYLETYFRNTVGYRCGNPRPW